jgi:predicted ferric reductase
MVIVALISIIPVLLWIFAHLPISVYFSDFYLILLSIGQIAGLVGLTMYSINLILSARLGIIENHFNGLNIVYKEHHKIGKYAFLLMILHPIFMFLSRITVSFGYAIDLIIPGKDFFVDLGLISLYLISTLLILTLFAKIPYHLWKLSHKFTGVVFVVAVFHSFLIPSTISSNKPLWFYMLLIVIAGISAYLYRTVFFKLFVKRYKYTISTVKKLNEKVVEITLLPTDINKKIEYYPGQFVFVSFKSEKVTDEIHPFSIASSDTNKIVIISKIEGDYTKNLMEIEINSEALIEGPYGRFSYHYFPNPNQIWIAGGIGVTPFVGMASSIKKESSFNIDLYNCLKEETEKLGIPVRNINLKPFFSKNMGHITAKYIKENSKNFDVSEFFICGPNKFMNELRKQLTELGIKNGKIHTEEFNYI